MARDPSLGERFGVTPVSTRALRSLLNQRGARTWNEGPDRASDPSQDSSQGDNPNIALTRPHINGLLTLDDR